VLEGLQELRGNAFLLRPGEGEALDAVSVGVLRGGEAAFRQAQLPQQVLDGLLDDAAVALLARHEPAVEVGRDEQRVVVEHLLEVRHEPPLVHGVPVEAAPEQVVHPAEGHPVEGRAHHREGVRVAGAQVEPEQELHRRGGRKLGRVPEAAPPGIELLAVTARSFAQQRFGQRVVRRLGLRAALHRLGERARLADDVAAPLAIQLGDPAQDLRKARDTMPRLRGEVRSADERLALGCQEHGHRPAAAAGHRDDGLHVDRVEVGALLAVDLDVHEEVVHERGRGRILERLVRHDVAPVAGGIADRKQDRLVLAARALQRLGAPGVPVHRVFGMLEEVRAGLVGEPVHPEGATLPWWWSLCWPRSRSLPRLRAAGPFT